MKTYLQTKNYSTLTFFILFLSFIFFIPEQQAQTLVGWWKMDEGSGTTLIDSSGSGNDAATTGDPGWVTGVINQAIDLDGGTQYAVVTDDPTLDITGAITLATWIRPKIQGTQRIIFKVSGSTGYELFLQNATPGFISVRFNGDAAKRVNSTTYYTDNFNTWMHIAATYDGATIKLYVNGLKENEMASVFTIGTSGTDLGLGANETGSNKFNGAIDDARVYNGALNADQIYALASIPTLVSPADGTTGLSVPPTLSWTASYTSPTSYRVQVSTYPNFLTSVFDQSGITSTSVSPTGISEGTKYYWRVNATTSADETSPWSSDWDFTTVIPAVVSNGAGYALDFDGTNDYVDCGTGGDITGTAITMEAWVNTNATTTQSVLKKNTATTGYELFLSSNTAGQNVAFRINNGPRVNSNSTYPTDTWIHVAATYNGELMQLFINGEFQGSTSTTTSILSSSSHLFIGIDGDGSTKLFSGKIDEVRLWDVVRFQSDIQSDMCQKLTGSESGLVGYWRFDETSGTSISDETSNNNGTLTDPGNDSHVWSAAALGDASAYDYDAQGGYTATISHSNGDNITATTTSGTITGLQVYRVDDNSFRTGSILNNNLVTVDPIKYWGVKVFGTSAVYELVYNYADQGGIVTEANLRLAKRDNLADATWDDAGAVLDDGANTLTLTGQPGTEYSLGSTTDPLPVELSSFSASILENGVRLKWRTETEVSNYGFEVQRSIRDDNWEVLGFVQGHGNSNSPKDYSFTDDNVTSRKYSYRLKQIDTDGSFDYSKIIEVEFGSAVKFELSQNYPNPFNPVTTIRFSIPQSGNVKLTVFNILGEQVAELVNGFREAGVHTINFDASQFNSGLYLYKIESNGLVRAKKMLLVK